MVTAIGFHCFILSMFPFASVMEWNVLCLYMILALFEANTLSLSAVASLVTDCPALALFLLVVAVAIPIYGQLHPKRVPFLAAYRRWGSSSPHSSRPVCACCCRTIPGTS